jgi:DNA-binding MarR family transcriptional regulator
MYDNLGRIIASIYRTGQSILNDRMKDFNISSGQISSLYAITMEEGLTQLELAELTFLGKSAITKEINILVDKGYVRRESDPSDLRVWRLYLTDQGRRISKSFQEAFREVISMHVKNLTEEEADQTTQILKKILTGLLEEKNKITKDNK